MGVWALRVPRDGAPHSGSASEGWKPTARPRAARSRSAEAALSRFFVDYVEQGRAGVGHLLRHPLMGLEAARCLWRLPVLTAAPSRTEAGALLRRALRRSLPLRLLLQGTTAVLEVPDDPGSYTAGHDRRDFRQNLRAAERLGVRYRTVQSERERAALLEIANHYERVNPRGQFRTAEPQNDDMPAMPIWLVAVDTSDAPILLAVVATDAEWAVLRYFRTLGPGPDASAARYGLMPVLVDRLRIAGIRYLVEVTEPHGLHNGLRLFQRRVGFRLVRIRFRSARPGPNTSAEAEHPEQSLRAPG